MATPAPPRPISIVKANSASRASGVLPAPSTADKVRINNVNTTGKPSSRLKVVVRRLAPGLTEEEFSTTLGNEWDVGKERVDWALYRQGKVSKE